MANRQGGRGHYRSYRSSNSNQNKNQTNRRKFNKKTIDVNKFINKAVPKSEEIIYKPQNKFEDFAFSDRLKLNIQHKGYETPSSIQDQTIPHILSGRDVVGLANTGTGKTAAFLLPIIEHLLNGLGRSSVLIIAPTRELAQQIDQELKSFVKGLSIYSTLVVGGMPINRQISELKRGPHIIIGTPGRIKDLASRNFIKFNLIKTIVLDEADRMLDMGFLKDIDNIISQIQSNHQTLLFSATITSEITTVISKFTNNPISVSSVTRETNEHIEQDVIKARDKNHKIEILMGMLDDSNYDKVLVFGETKYGVQRLSDLLDSHGIPSVAIHGNKNQSQRTKALSKFKNGSVRVMVATDVAARGLDIPNVSHVINFDTPQNYENYIHRIGRTGRAGASGYAHTFINI